MDIGHARARAWEQDWGKEYPGLRVVLLSKSVKSESGLTQCQEYEMEHWTFLRDAHHPDLALYGIEEEEIAAREAEEKASGGILPTAQIYGSPTNVKTERLAPIGRNEMVREYGVAVQPEYQESGTFQEAPED